MWCMDRNPRQRVVTSEMGSIEVEDEVVFADLN